MDSVWVFYSSEGKLQRSIQFAENLKNGEYIVYDSLAMIQFYGRYIRDTLQGPYQRFFHGKLVEEGIYKKGKIDGKQKEYDPESGNLILLTDFTNGEKGEDVKINRFEKGKKIGLWQKYDEKGNLIKQEVYLNGELVTEVGTPFNFEKEYFLSGRVKNQYMKQNGYKNGIQTNFDSLGNQQISYLYQNDTLLAEGWISKDGSKDSLWKFYDQNGNIINKGNFIKGVKEGLWIYYFENGSIEQKGKYKENLPHGEWLWYYPNGQLRRQENFYKGKYEGEIKDFDTIGNLVQSRNFSFNILEGNLYYFIGDHQEFGKMQNGVREGKWMYYYNKDKKAFIGKFKDGFPEGKHLYWFGNGRRAYLMKYKNGKLHGRLIEYIESGGVNHIYIFKRGILKTLDGEVIKEKVIKQ